MRNLLESLREREREQMSDPTGEYLFAKAELCYTLAQKQLEEMQIAEAIKNIERANRAMARIFNLDEEESK